MGCIEEKCREGIVERGAGRIVEREGSREKCMEVEEQK